MVGIYNGVQARARCKQWREPIVLHAQPVAFDRIVVCTLYPCSASVRARLQVGDRGDMAAFELCGLLGCYLLPVWVAEISPEGLGSKSLARLERGQHELERRLFPLLLGLRFNQKF